MDANLGVSSNRFFDYPGGGKSTHYQSEYKADPGYAVGFGFNFPIDSFQVRMTLMYESYAGSIEASEGALGGGYFVNAYIKKDVISMAVLPLIFKVKKFSINAGLEGSLLVDEKNMGTANWWTYGQPTITKDLNEVFDSFNSSFNFGLRLQFAFDIPISSQVYITPQYSFYYGLTNEFKEFPEQTKSRRHYFLIGLGKKI